MNDFPPEKIIDLANELAVAWLANPNTRADHTDVTAFLKAVHETIGQLSHSAGGGLGRPEDSPYVDPAQSLASKDHIISLIDGKPYKALRRHLARHGLTPDDYRRKFGLTPDYPMVAENYSRERRELANKTWIDRKVEQDTKRAVESVKPVKSSKARRASAR